MSGTRQGGKNAAKTNKQKHGDDFYAKIGAIGGKAKVKKGFAMKTYEELREIGARGGSISRKTRW